MLEMSFVMRSPCSHCGSAEGYSRESNGQDVVFCDNCGRWCYNRPKAESGKPQAHVRTRPNIKPSQKVRILERDHHTCVMCHAADQPLHVGHLISVKDGREHGLTEEELFSDLNMCAFCSECNLGLGRSSVGLPFMVKLFRIHQKASQ